MSDSNDFVNAGTMQSDSVSGSGETVLSLEGVSCSLSGNSVLKDFSMTMRPGTVYALLGRNGAGKSTLLRLLLGLIPRDAGLINVLGLDPAVAAHLIKDRVGFVSEGRELYGWMTVDETLGFAAGFTTRWDPDHCRSLVETLGLDGGNKVRTLSRGERCKLWLILALACHPKLLILDEPTAGLDAIVRREFLEQTIEAIASEGTSVLFATHELDAVQSLADRVGILRGGRLLVEEDLEVLKESCRVVHLRLKESDAPLAEPPGTIASRRDGCEARLIVLDFCEPKLTAIKQSGATIDKIVAPDLEELFVETLKGGR